MQHQLPFRLSVFLAHSSVTSLTLLFVPKCDVKSSPCYKSPCKWEANLLNGSVKLASSTLTIKGKPFFIQTNLHFTGFNTSSPSIRR